MNKKEEYYNNIIEENQYNYARENRINAEIEAYLIEMDSTYLNSIDKWMEKYDRDLETMEIDIQYLKEKREEQITKLENLSKLVKLFFSPIFPPTNRFISSMRRIQEKLKST